MVEIPLAAIKQRFGTSNLRVTQRSTIDIFHLLGCVDRLHLNAIKNKSVAAR